MAFGVRRRGGGQQKKEGVRCQEGEKQPMRGGRKEAWLQWGEGLAVKPGGRESGRAGWKCILQPLPASLFLVVSPIQGAFQDSGKAAGLAKVRCKGKADRRGSTGTEGDGGGGTVLKRHGKGR